MTSSFLRAFGAGVIVVPVQFVVFVVTLHLSGAGLTQKGEAYLAGAVFGIALLLTALVILSHD